LPKQSPIRIGTPLLLSETLCVGSEFALIRFDTTARRASGQQTLPFFYDGSERSESLVVINAALVGDTLSTSSTKSSSYFAFRLKS
jgi:hypothetical protein